jgi:hypothetical protein
MRAWTALLLIAACGEPDQGGDDFNENGGTFAVPGCTYSVTTRLGAERPRVAGTRLGSDPTPMQVHLGIMGDPKTSIVAQWRTKDETTQATTLRYGVGANLAEAELTQTVNGIEFGYRSTGTQIHRMHQVHLCDLSPGTTYSYQVGSPGHFSPIYTFRTAPDVEAHPDSEVVFGFVGDSRGGYDVWEQLAMQLKMRTPDLVLFSGDAVTIGLTQYEWDEFFTRAEPLFATTPLVMAHGNHEVNAVNFFSQLAMPGDQQNFGFDYGHAHITVANDTTEDPYAISGEVRDAIAADFAASNDARWKLLMHHQPLWSASTRHGSNEMLQQAWGPLIDQHRIDLVLNGHDHCYEITKPLVAGQVQASNADATVYVIAGGAGADLYGNGNELFTQYSESSHSAAVIRASRFQLTLDAFHPDGTALPAEASFSKSKP